MKVKDNIKDKLAKLPSQSGVYIMLNNEGRILYVGKAKVLKNRVRQYFQATKKPRKVRAMVSKVDDFRYIVTESETDAFSLENNLIKKYNPPYNILLKDGKEYAYIKIDVKSDFPKILMTRKVVRDGAKYFGPLVSGVRALLELLGGIFPTVTCNVDYQRLPKGFRPCLKKDLGTCAAPCAGLISKEAYREIIDRAVETLEGDDSYARGVITQKMTEASLAMQYEAAIEYRNMLQALDNLKDKRVVNTGKLIDCDIFAIVTNGINNAVSVLCVRRGRIIFADNYLIDDAAIDTEESLSSFIRAYIESSEGDERNLITNVKLDDGEAVAKYLSGLKGVNIAVKCAQKGIKRQLVDMAEKNATEYLDKRQSAEDKLFNTTVGAITQLKNDLGLSKLPRRIECYDISHLSGTDMVASMTVFTDGQKDSKAYRHYKIKTVEGNNDFACMKEVLLRRFEKLNEGDLRFGAVPDLIVVDGGKGQLTYALEAREESGQNVEIISLAKRFELVYLPDESEPVELVKNSFAYNLLVNIRDEAHRFAITYQRGLHAKSTIKSELTAIDGIGEKRAAALIRLFKSINGIKKATAEQLIEVGLSEKLAQSVLDYFAKRDS
ncbi:MAG: excinuclease ABC subunit UvrC [Clostridia bacterium]|nr:excinuclease ABC subunit UvrC [Clostridia bacterium]